MFVFFYVLGLTYAMAIEFTVQMTCFFVKERGLGINCELMDGLTNMVELL